MIKKPSHDPVWEPASLKHKIVLTLGQILKRLLLNFNWPIRRSSECLVTADIFKYGKLILGLVEIVASVVVEIV